MPEPTGKDIVAKVTEISLAGCNIGPQPDKSIRIAVSIALIVFMV